ncbi:MAG: CPBP family intramembrane metalloprotease [Promethearchaeota archaeon]|nr:MAG: CPBP family intramembrane metalloprotease [Candidatus Lokiarchaeota archaeon]
MEFYIVNLLYFIITVPIVLITFPFLSKLCKNKRDLSLIILLSLLLFTVRLVLIFFQDTIGIMPYLIEDVIFYSLLMIFGVIFTIFYMFKIEKVSLKEIGGNVYDFKKSIFYGFVAYIPLLCLLPLIQFLTEIHVSFNITLGKILVAIAFAVLAGFYEEIMFRGIIQNHFMEITKNNSQKSIIFTSITFTATHIFYLPFVGYGIYYLFVFIMGLLLSSLRAKYDLLASSILHGGIVFILIVLV